MEPWRDEASPFRDYYFFRKGKECPNNWTSFFSGSAWNYYEDRKEWALHLFSKKQMDLNWENPALRRDIEKMIRWWLEKGVDGFRMDVINYISKTPGHTRFEDYRYDLNYLKTYYMDWMEHYGNHCWMSLFYENHDNPRMVSKVNPEPAFREVIAKLLALIQFTLKGTPFLYQGQELGAVNADFKDISELRDVESRNLYEELLKTMSREEAFHKVLSGTRDHARVMMRYPFTWNAISASG